MDLQFKPLVEALLFISTDPVSPEEIERVVGISKSTIVELINTLADEYDREGRGFQIRKVGKGYSITTRSEYAEYIRELYQPKVQQRLTQAALETLAIIAYKQPITRGEIEEIRGVKVEKALITLQKRGLIQELGRKQTIGTPIIYGTTEEFLKYFGLEDLTALPEPADFAGLGQTVDDDEFDDMEFEGDESKELNFEFGKELSPTDAQKIMEKQGKFKGMPNKGKDSGRPEYEPLPLLNLSND